MQLQAGLVKIVCGVSLIAGMVGSVGATPIEFCDGEYTTVDLNNCTSKNLKYEDNKINSSYKKLRGLLNATEKNELKLAQLAWIDFRDKSCKFSARQLKGGSAYIMEHNSCLINYTYQRRIELDKEISNTLR